MSTVKKVVIIGAGPCGLLLAHYLLQRPEPYQVELYERRCDPRTVTVSDTKTIPYGLSERGLRALRPLAGLEDTLKTKCVENWGTIIHKKNGKTQLWQKQQPTYNTDRTSLVIILLSQLEQRAQQGQVKIHFNFKCTKVDLAAKTVSFEQVTEQAEEDFRVSYDVLVGTDGARSVVRTHLLNTPFFEFEQKYVYSVYKTVFLPGRNDQAGIALKPDCIHIWRVSDGITFGAVPRLDGNFWGLLFFPQRDNPVLHLKTPEQVMGFFREQMPEVGQLLSVEEATAFLEKPLATQLKVRCNRYHYSDSVLIMGDAAHAISSSLGQGCCNAFEDVLVFNSLLDECGEDWEQALEQFTVRRQPDAEALWELDTNVFPANKALFAEFILRESFSKVMHKLLPGWFVPPLRVLIPGSTPYSDILKSYQGWISKVKRANEQFVVRQKYE